MTFGVISNSMLGVQGIQSLINRKKIVGVAIPERFNEANEMAEMICNQRSIPLQVIREKSKSEDLERWLESSQPEAVIAAGFPFKIDPRHLSVPEFGFWNIHAGKLPEYAGADPVFWQIKNQIKSITLTVHKMIEKMDKGPILFESSMEVPGEKTYGQVWQQLQQTGAPLFFEIVTQLEGQSFQLKNQPTSNKDFSKRPGQEDLIINWRKMSADEVIALVNACNPNYGGALALYRGGYIRILRIKRLSEERKGKAGEIVKADADGLWVQTRGNQLLSIEITNMVQGYLTGPDLVSMDIRVGDCFDDPSRV